MSKTYTVGRNAKADIRIGKTHDAVGKLHLELTDLGKGEVSVRDLNSTNGTFVREEGKWVRIKDRRTFATTQEIMLGDYVTTPKELLSALTTPPPLPAAKEPEPAAKPAKTAKRLRRNEFGEIVHE